MGHFVTHVKEKIPCLTLRHGYESNGAHLGRPWTYLFVRHKKVGDLLVAIRGSGSVLNSIRVDMCG